MGITARIHGKRGLIYVSGSELLAASAVTITETTDSEEGPEFGDKFPARAVGLMHWGGTITAWHAYGIEILFQCATNGWPVDLLAYPSRDNMAAFYTGQIILSFEHSQEVTGLVGETASFVGHNALGLNP